MNNHELHVKVHAAMYVLIKDKGVASAVDVLMAIGCLSKKDYEDWRNGRVPFLERVCGANLHKLSRISHEIRVYAQKHSLKPSWTEYRQWGKGKHTRLRFSKSGDKRVEELYATHYVSQAKAEEAKKRRESQNCESQQHAEVSAKNSPPSANRHASPRRPSVAVDP